MPERFPSIADVIHMGGEPPEALDRQMAREADKGRWAKHGGIPTDKLDRPLGDDFDEVLPARERNTTPGERVIELKFRSTG